VGEKPRKPFSRPSSRSDGAASRRSYPQAGVRGRKMVRHFRKAAPMKEEFTMDDAGWVVAGILTDLEGAVLTYSVGDGGLAGTLEMAGQLALAANDGHFGRREGELG
jgi:hypothetical protein